MRNLHTAIAESLEPFGGHLGCEVCHHKQSLGDIATKLAKGWPKHCGYTMRWRTDSQINASDGTKG